MSCLCRILSVCAGTRRKNHFPMQGWTPLHCCLMPLPSAVHPSQVGACPGQSVKWCRCVSSCVLCMCHQALLAILMAALAVQILNRSRLFASLSVKSLGLSSCLSQTTTAKAWLVQEGVPHHTESSFQAYMRKIQFRNNDVDDDWAMAIDEVHFITPMHDAFPAYILRQ